MVFSIVGLIVVLGFVTDTVEDDASSTIQPHRNSPYIPRTRVSVSGQSAGGSMAIQHLFIWSSKIDGALIAAGSPYGCGQQPLHSLTCYFGGLDVADSIRYVVRRHTQSLIDDPFHLKSIPVVLFSGKNDWVVWQPVMHSTLTQLTHFISRPPRVLFDSQASHVWSLDHGHCSCGACALFDGPPLCCYVNNCGIDLSAVMLHTFFGSSVIRPPAKASPNSLRWVEQWQFMPPHALPRGNASTLLKWGVVYLPSSCTSAELMARCRRHVHYHGCSADSWPQRLGWIESIGLNEYAETNELIVIYPQAAGSGSIGVGCWNWASYEDDPLFDTQHGVQLQTVLKMVDELPRVLAKAQVAVDFPPTKP